MIEKYIIVVIIGTGIGEIANCLYPRVEEGYNSEGFVCKWEEDDFYFINDQYILAPEDSTDNCFEEKARRRYWNKRDK